jgi:PLP dependent protein
MNDIVLNINKIREQLPDSINVVAVSKTRSLEEILVAYNAGHRIFGENRVQELLTKKDKLPNDIQWHLIGHLQSNKIKFIVPFISMIQSVDSSDLLAAINAEASKTSRTINCLFQIHIAREESKYGFLPEELIDLLEAPSYKTLANINICGVMGMATFTDDLETVRKEFRFLKTFYDRLKKDYFSHSDSFSEISMGMSGDYLIASEEGSTIVRIGSLIFGERK